MTFFNRITGRVFGRGAAGRSSAVDYIVGDGVAVAGFICFIYIFQIDVRRTVGD